MANRDMVIGGNQDVSLKMDQYLGIGNNHEHLPRHAYSYGLGLSHDNDVFWEQKMAPPDSQIPNDEINEEKAFGGTDEANTNDNQNESFDDTFALSLSNGNDSVSSRNDDVAVEESQGFDGNLQLAVGQSTSGSVHQSQSLMDLPATQSRPLVSLPEHELVVGREFSDVHACRRALRDAAIAHRFEIQTVKSDKTRFTAKCANEVCPWRIHCAKLSGVPTFTIRTIHGSHTCAGITHLGHQQASVQWVADTVAEQIKENPHCKPKEILEEIHRVHGIALTYKQAWRGKERIMSSVRGSFEEDYRLLPKYCDQVRRTNPGSIAEVNGSLVDGTFQQLFISYQASIYGFLNACQPLIALDKTVLKSKYLGTLLLAAGFDGDGAVFPLAFAVIDEENDGNWQWFLSKLHHLLEINTENMPKLTILSSREKSIVEGVEANFPTAFHGFCIHYLIECFRKEFNDPVLVNLLWEAADSLIPIGFQTKVLEIQQVSPEAALWVRNLPPNLWAASYFEGTRLGHLTANISDSLKTWINNSSGLPIIQMMESIRRQLMTLFNQRRETSMQWKNMLVPSAEARVIDAIENSQAFQVLRGNEAEFEVITDEGNFVVDIRTRTCFCRGWQQYGLPCGHAVAALATCRQNVYRFTESYFTVANYRRTYSQTIHPIPDRAMWNEMDSGLLLKHVPELEDYDPEREDYDYGYNSGEIVVRPPKLLKPQVRQRKKRVRSEDGGSQGKRVVHCSRCNQTGHFRTTCSAPI